MSDWYKNFKAQVAKSAKQIDKPIEPTQEALWFKNIICEAMEGKEEGFYTFKHEDKYGFSELLVNQIIMFAFQYARSWEYKPSEHERVMVQRGFERGYEQAMSEVREFTGGNSDD